MSKIHVIIDSTANPASDLLQKYPNLHIVPLKVILGDKEWPETEITAEEMVSLAASCHAHPRTSQPAPGEFIELFERLIAAGSEIIVITLSGELSGTVQGAMSAAAIVARDKIHVIDSGTTAMGMIHLAVTALNMVDEGIDITQIVDRLKAMVLATHTMFVPNTLEYLHKGGRIGGAALVFGSIFQIRPILYLVQGKVAVLDKVRTRTKAISKMVEVLKQQEQAAYIGVGHICAQEEAETVANQLRQLYPNLTITVHPIGAVLGAHLGPGLIGIIYQQRID